MKPLDPRVLPHLRPAYPTLAVVLTAQVVGGFAVIAQAFAVAGTVVGLIADPGGSQWLTPALWLIGISVLRAAAAWVGEVAATSAAGQVAEGLRQGVLRAALDSGPDLGRRRTGELAVLATRGVNAVEPYLTRYLPTLVLAGVLPVLVIVTIGWLDWLSALIVVLTLPLIPVFAILIGLTTQEKADRQWHLLSRLSAHFLDVVRGLPTLVAFRRGHAQSAKIREITDHYRRATLETLKIAFVSSAALELIATISVALVAVCVGLRLAYDGIDFQVALTVLLLAPEAYWPLRRVGAEYHAAAEGTATFEAINELQDDSPAATPSGLSGPSGFPEAAADRAPGAASDVPSGTGLILDQVEYAYPGRDRPALAPVTAVLPARGVTAIAGPSGCGKSTLLALLLGERSPSSGTIRAYLPDGDEAFAATDSLDPNGRGVGPTDPQWRTRVAHLGQQPWLAAQSVAENLLLGRPEATEEEVREALRQVDLLEVVTRLPAGIHTVLEEDGRGFSAGQRARLAMARVILAARPYVLLDEPTAHVDAATEQVLLRAIRALGTTSCVVVVAHRDAVLEAADQVLALEPVGSPAAASAVPIDVHDRPRRTHALGSEADSPTATGATGVAGAAGADRPRRRTGLATLLGTASSASGVALTATAGWLIARSAEHPPVLFLMVAIVCVRMFGLARPVLRYAERLVSHDAALRQLAQRRAEVYDRLVPLSPGSLGRRRGDLLTSVVDDVDALIDDQLRVRMPIRTWLGVGAVATVVATAIHLPAGMVVAAVCLVGGIVAWGSGFWGSKAAQRHAVEQRARLSGQVVETLQDGRELLTWQADRAALAQVDTTTRALGAAALRQAHAMAAGRGIATLVGGLGVVGVAAVFSATASTDPVGGPLMAMLVLMPLALAEVLTPLADAGALQVHTRAATARLDRLAELPPATTEPATPSVLAAEHPGVRARGLSVQWGERPGVESLDLDLPPGRLLGVVGPSGSGKTTLAFALMRFLMPTGRGQLTWGGTDHVDVIDLDGDQVRTRVGLIDDDPYLFGSSLVENVRLARPEATDAEVAAALTQAHLGAWVATLPRGLDTPLGDGGEAVSGGERARIGLARALLARQPVWVFDEPTSHLDTETAQAVTRDLLDQARAQGRSVVWITHTPAGLDRMDQVLALT